MKVVICLLAILGTLWAASPSQWRGKTIYQVLTDRFSKSQWTTAGCGDLSNYCGGTFRGLINNISYIQGMGFDAIWISPIPVNYPGGYHGYWATQWYDINPNFGTVADLQELIKVYHNAGMWVMLDVVANHVGPVGMDFSQINPFNSNNNYHAYCEIQNWNDQHQVEYCRLAGLPDLNQEDQDTANTLLKWVNQIVSNYSFDGLRVDTVPEVPVTFWSQWTQSAGVYTVGEVFNGNINYGAGYQGALSGILNYPMYYTIRSVFQSSQSMNNIQGYYQSANIWPDQTLLGIFVDNHDNPRFLYQNGNTIMFKAALAFSLSVVGIPIIYYGDEQEFNGGPDPNCREVLWPSMNTNADVYQYIKTIIAFRKKVQFGTQPQVQRWSDDTFYAFTRGNYFFAFTNGENTQTRSITYHPYSNGQVLCNIFWANDCVTVANNQFPVTLLNGEVKMYYPKGSYSPEYYLYE